MPDSTAPHGYRVEKRDPAAIQEQANSLIKAVIAQSAVIALAVPIKAKRVASEDHLEARVTFRLIEIFKGPDVKFLEAAYWEWCDGGCRVDQAKDEEAAILESVIGWGPIYFLSGTDSAKPKYAFGSCSFSLDRADEPFTQAFRGELGELRKQRDLASTRQRRAPDR